MSIESFGPQIRSDLGNKLNPADGVFNNVIIKKNGEVEKKVADDKKVDLIKVWEELKDIIEGDLHLPAGNAYGFDGIKGEIKGGYKDKINFNPNAYKHASENAQQKASIKSAIKLQDESGILIGLDQPGILIGDKLSPAGNAYGLDGIKGEIKDGIKGEYKDKINFNPNAYKHANENAQIKASIKSAIKLQDESGILIGLDVPDVLVDGKLTPAGNAYGYYGVKGEIKDGIKGEYKDKINFNTSAYKHANENAQIKASIKSAFKLQDESGILIGLDQPGILISDKLSPAGNAYGLDGIKGEYKDKINFNSNAYKHASDNAQLKASIKSAINFEEKTDLSYKDQLK